VCSFQVVVEKVSDSVWSSGHTALARYKVSNISDYSAALERFEEGRKGEGTGKGGLGRGIKELLDTYESGLKI
jgi:hypothetical protein